MLRIKTPNRKKVKANLGLSRDSGFYVPPTAMFFDCKEPKQTPLATGSIIEPNNRRTQILTRRGPITIKKPKHLKGDLFKIVKRDSFLPERQVSYTLAPYPYRLGEEERKQAKLEDIERNGQLVQISNKTMDRVYDKFDLFTISDDILKKVRTGEMSKKEARASALLGLSREIKNALSAGDKKKVDKVIADIKKADGALIPEIDEIGEIKDNPIADLVLLSSVAPNYNPEVFKTLSELLDKNIFRIDPDNTINGVVDFIEFVNSTPADIEAVYRQSQYDESLSELKPTLETFLKYHYRDLIPPPEEQKSIPPPEEQSMIDDEPEEVKQEIEEPLEPIKSRKEISNEFYENLSNEEARFTAQVVSYIKVLSRDINKIIENIDISTESVETGNIINEATMKQKNIINRLNEINDDLKKEETTLPDVEGEVKKLIKELETIVLTLADDLGEVSKKPVAIVPPPPPPEVSKKLSFIDELLGKKTGLKKTKTKQKEITLEEQLKKGVVLKSAKERKLKPKPETKEEKERRELKERVQEQLTRMRSGTLPPEEPPEEEVKEVKTEEIQLPANYNKGEKLTADEEIALTNKGQRNGTKDDVWRGLVIKTSSGIRREDLVFDKEDGKIKSIKQVMGSIRAAKTKKEKKEKGKSELKAHLKSLMD